MAPPFPRPAALAALAAAGLTFAAGCGDIGESRGRGAREVPASKAAATDRTSAPDAVVRPPRAIATH
jgi:hypothetical protein